MKLALEADFGPSNDLKSPVTTHLKGPKNVLFFLPHSEQSRLSGKNRLCRRWAHKLKNYKPQEEMNHHEGESRHKNKWKLATQMWT